MASSGPLGWLGWPGAGWNNLTGDILSVPQISWWAAFLAVCHVVFLDDFLPSPLLIATGEAIPLRGLEGVPGLQMLTQGCLDDGGCLFQQDWEC